MKEIIYKIVLILFLFSESSCNKEVQNVKIECYYMAYACGDCTPQYKVKDVYKPLSIKGKLIGEDIDVSFERAGQRTRFEQEIGNCGICYWYTFSGKLNFSRKKKCYVLIVSSYSLKMKSKDCCSSVDTKDGL